MSARVKKMENSKKDNCCSELHKREPCCLPDCCEKKAQLFFSFITIAVSVVGIFAIYEVANTVERRENRSDVINCRQQMIPTLSKLSKSIDDSKIYSKRYFESKEEKFLTQIRSISDYYFSEARGLMFTPVCSKKYIEENDKFFRALRTFDIKLREGTNSDDFLMDAISGIDYLSDFKNRMNVLDECCVSDEQSSYQSLTHK